MTEQQRIDAKCAKIKAEYLATYPICIFCLQRVHKGACELAHKIRRSETSDKFSRFELATLKKNTGLAHSICHKDFDNNPELAKSYPGYKQVMKDISEIDHSIYLKLINR